MVHIGLNQNRYMKHKHHIVPKHMGGSDESSNIIELSITEHAEAHKLLYNKYGHWQDYVAWKGLEGLLSKEDILKIMYSERIGEKNPMYGKPCYYKMTEKQKSDWKRKISETSKGKKQSVEHIKKRTESRLKNPKIYGKKPWNKGMLLGPQSAELRRKKGKPLIFNDVEYNSIHEAEKLTGISRYKIKKSCYFISE